MTSVDYGTYLFFIMLVYFVWHYIYRKVIIEYYRAKMYELRSELFFFASEGNIEFNSHQYRIAETILNSAIQKVESVGIVRFFVLHRIIFKKRYKNIHKIGKDIASLNKELNIAEIPQVDYIQKILQKADSYSGMYLLLSNPIMLTFISLYLLYILLVVKIKAPKEIIGTWGHSINWEANNQFAV
jgi:hypothetical protein